MLRGYEQDFNKLLTMWCGWRGGGGGGPKPAGASNAVAGLPLGEAIGSRGSSGRRILFFCLFREATQLKTVGTVCDVVGIEYCHVEDQAHAMGIADRRGPTVSGMACAAQGALAVAAVARGGACRAGASEAGNKHRAVAGLRRGWLRPARLEEPHGFSFVIDRAPWKILFKSVERF